MMWALIFMVTSGRTYAPEYVELYETRKECIEKMPKSSWFERRGFCVPVESKK